MADTELANNHIFRVVKDLTEPSNASTFSRFVTMYGVGTVEALAEFSSEGLERVGFSPHLIGELTQILDENYGGLTFALPDKARSVEIGQLEQTIESASELVGQDTAQKPLRETSYVDQVVRGYDVIDQGSYLLVNGNKVEIPTSANALSKERITEIFKLHSDGADPKDIAECRGVECSPITVTNYLKKGNVVPLSLTERNALEGGESTSPQRGKSTYRAGGAMPLSPLQRAGCDGVGSGAYAIKSR